MACIAQQSIRLLDGRVVFIPDFLAPEFAAESFQQLQQQIHWASRTIRLFGRTLAMPRLIAWYADTGVRYRYSGGETPRNDWNEPLLAIKALAETQAGQTFNGALLNLYRNGRDHMSWHSDDEASLGPHPLIASISLGAQRIFQLRDKTGIATPLSLPLNSGSLLLMTGDLQQQWQHRIVRTARPVGARINITFRRIVG